MNTLIEEYKIYPTYLFKYHGIDYVVGENLKQILIECGVKEEIFKRA